MLDELESDPTSLQLNGQTRIVPVLGFPVKQVRSPRPLSLKMQRLGFNAIQVPMLVSVETFSQVVASLKLIDNVAGLVLTVPHKMAALSHVDHLSARAKAAGSINAMRREANGSWTGENFDGAGFVAGLRADGHDPSGKSIMIVGLGGAGASLAASLAEAGAARLELFDLDPARTDLVSARIKTHHPNLPITVLGTPISAQADIAVNATHLGMDEADALPFEPTDLKSDAIVADVIMKPAETKLLRSAAASGHRTVRGENVLFYQLDLLARFFAQT